MSKRARLWLLSAILYALFTFWYTDFGGPLSEDEVAGFVAQMRSNGTAPEQIAFIEKFAREDTGRQFLMVNNIDNNENPPHVEGAEPGESAEELMNRYMEHMYPALFSRACQTSMPRSVGAKRPPSRVTYSRSRMVLTMLA